LIAIFILADLMVMGALISRYCRVGSSCKTATADAERHLEKEHVRVSGTWEPASKKRRR
jgi:hypothetical protein